MKAEPAFRFRVDANTRRLLDRLRDERHINISAWARKHIRNALRAEFPDELTDQQERHEETAGETLETQQPIPGWRPRKVSRDGEDEWCAALAGPEVARLPRQLPGIQIAVTTTAGKSWTGTINEVVSISEDLAVVRYSRSGTD